MYMSTLLNYKRVISVLTEYICVVIPFMYIFTSPALLMRTSGTLSASPITSICFSVPLVKIYLEYVGCPVPSVDASMIQVRFVVDVNLISS